VERVAEILELPSGAVCVFGLCVGYAKPGAESHVKPRLAQPAILFHDRYDSTHDEAHRKAYDEVLAQYSKTHEMSQHTWTERVLNRLGPIKSMNGRHVLKGALRSLGFRLD
jgi:hypothetical protein